MKGSEFVFDYVHLLYYKCHKIDPNHGGSYIDSPDWIALKYEEIKKDPQRITKIKLFINKYNWEGIHFSSEKADWKRFDKNNVTIALNALYAKKEKIYPAHISKHNSNCEKQVILLMISNGAKMQR